MSIVTSMTISTSDILYYVIHLKCYVYSVRDINALTISQKAIQQFLYLSGPKEEIFYLIS